MIGLLEAVLMSVQVNAHSSYCPIEVISGRSYVYRASVQLAYCQVGLLFG